MVDGHAMTAAPDTSASPAPLHESVVREALGACERTTARHSSTFSLGSRFFPATQRQAVTAVYAACRVGDDAVDEAVDLADAQKRLEAWWQGIERAYAGTPDRTRPYEVGLAWTLERYDVPKEAFHELRQGFESDLFLTCMETMDDLLLYCRRVAGVVGWMITPIAGYKGGPETLEAALALGNAMQLTNVLRDVGEDLNRNRCYLPQELLDTHGVTLHELRKGSVSDAYVALLEDLACEAERLYDQGWSGVPKLQGAAKYAVAVAAENYQAILRKLRANRYDNLNRRAYLRTHERLQLIPIAVWHACFPRQARTSGRQEAS